MHIMPLTRKNYSYSRLDGIMNSRKKGFRKIDNDLFAALIAARLPGAVYQIVLTVIDKTIGFHKEWASVSLSYFEKVTGLSRRGIVKAIKKAELRGIIEVERFSTRKTLYTINLNCGKWLTSERQYSNRLVNYSAPDWVTAVHQTRELITPTTTSIKETFKETRKEREPGKENTPPDELLSEGSSSAPPVSLSLYAPKGKVEANNLTNGVTVLMGEDRATLESDLSAPISPSRGMLPEQKITYRQRIVAYLTTQGSASISEICQATGVKYNLAYLTLRNGRDKCFHHFKEKQMWGLIDSGDKPC